jgi:predicted Fe-S protein YdhL (DUF1289 family)
VTDKLLTRVPTPCIGVCSTGIGDAVCRGCKRYAHEVIHWNSYTDEQKWLIHRRLDQLLSQIVLAKLTVFDPDRLERQLKCQQIRYSAFKSPAVWVFELLRAGASQIADCEQFGFAVAPGYRELSLTALREQIDREFFVLSEAHYQRYIRVAIEIQPAEAGDGAGVR